MSTALRSTNERIREALSRDSDRRRSLRRAQENALRFGRACRALTEQTRRAEANPAGCDGSAAEQRAWGYVGGGTQIGRAGERVGDQRRASRFALRGRHSGGARRSRVRAGGGVNVHDATQRGRKRVRNQRKMQRAQDLQQRNEPRHEGAERFGSMLRSVHRDTAQKYRGRASLANQVDQFDKDAILAAPPL